MRHARKHAKAMQKMGREARREDEHDKAEFIARRMACGLKEQDAEHEYYALRAEDELDPDIDHDAT